MVGLGETKLRILERLRARPASASELARDLGLSRVAVHRHLADLEAEGLVRAHTEKCNGRGRPRQVYHAVDAEAPYARICGEVLGHLKALYGSGAVIQVLSARNAQIAAELKPLLQGKPLGEQLQQLARFLTERGYKAEVRREDGAWVLMQHRCPKLAVSKEHAELCETELELYRHLLEVPVVQECRIAEGGDCCRYRIPTPPG